MFSIFVLLINSVVFKIITFSFLLKKILFLNTIFLLNVANSISLTSLIYSHILNILRNLLQWLSFYYFICFCYPYFFYLIFFFVLFWSLHIQLYCSLLFIFRAISFLLHFFLFYSMNTGDTNLFNADINGLSTSDFRLDNIFSFFASSFSMFLSLFFMFLIHFNIFFHYFMINHGYRSDEALS